MINYDVFTVLLLKFTLKENPLSFVCKLKNYKKMPLGPEIYLHNE